MDKAQDAFRTISEVATELGVPKHVLRFWEAKFPQIKPMKRGGGRRYYRPEDMQLLAGIRRLLHADGYIIKGVQKILREQGVESVKRAGDSSQQIQSGRAPKTQTGTTKTPSSRTKTRGKRNQSKTADAKGAGLEQETASKIVAALEKARLNKRESIAQIDDLIQELEACRALLVGERPSKAGKSAPTRKSGAARSA